MLTVGLVAPLAACSTVFTSTAPEEVQVLRHGEKPRKANGLAYFLPKTLVNVTIQPLGVKSGTVVSGLSNAEKEAIMAGHRIYKSIKVGTSWHRVQVNENGALIRDLVNDLELAQITDDTNDYQHVPDTNHQYFLGYKANALSDDLVCATVNNQGLLENVSANIRDRTGQVLVAIADFIARVASNGVAPNAFTTLKNNVTTTVPVEQFTPLKVQIDPLNAHDISSVMSAIRRRYGKLADKFEFTVPDLNHFIGPVEKSGEKYPACDQKTVCYRTRVPLRLVLKQKRSKAVSVAYAKVANQRVIGKVDVTRAFLVDKVTKLDFDNGTLTNFVVNKQSEALAAAKLPLTIYDTVITSLLAAPGRFVASVTASDLENKTQSELLVDRAGELSSQTANAKDLRNNLQALRDLGLDTTALTAQISCQDPA